MKLPLAMAALVAGGGTGGAAAEPPAGDTVAINVSRDVGWSGSEAIEIQQSGPSSRYTSYNYDGRPEIGIWQHPLPRERFDTLLSLLRRSGYERLPVPAVVPPGPTALVLGERKQGQAHPTLRVFDKIPDGLKPVLAFIDTTRSELLAHPLRVLRGELQVKAAAVERGGRIEMAFALTNVGSASLTLANPLATASGWNGLRLALRPVSGQGEQTTDLSVADLATAGQDRAPILTLAPGQTVRFALHPKLDVPAGKHVVRFEYHSMTEPKETLPFVGGTLVLPAGEITVTRKPWWKVW